MSEISENQEPVTAIAETEMLTNVEPTHSQDDVALDDVTASSTDETNEPPASEVAPDAHEHLLEQDSPASIKKRLNKFYAEKKAAEDRERQEAARRRELELLLQQYMGKPSANTSVDPYMPTEPDENDAKYANNHKLYVKDYVAYEKAKMSYQAQQQQQIMRQQTLQQKYQSSVEQAQGKYADFNESLSRLYMPPEHPYTQGLIEAIQDDDNGADIAYHLAKNPHLIQSLYQGSFAQAAKVIGRLSVELAATPVQKPKPTAPPPPRNIKGASVTSTKGIEALSTEELARRLRSRR